MDSKQIEIVSGFYGLKLAAMPFQSKLPALDIRQGISGRMTKDGVNATD